MKSSAQTGSLQAISDADKMQTHTNCAEMIHRTATSYWSVQSSAMNKQPVCPAKLIKHYARFWELCIFTRMLNTFVTVGRWMYFVPKLRRKWSPLLLYGVAHHRSCIFGYARQFYGSRMHKVSDPFSYQRASVCKGSLWPPRSQYFTHLHLLFGKMIIDIVADVTPWREWATVRHLSCNYWKSHSNPVPTKAQSLDILSYYITYLLTSVHFYILA
jgi:hypothetical protein